ncbi:MAG: MraY family glycosyltransferase [Bacteroidota bacterium]
MSMMSFGGNEYVILSACVAFLITFFFVPITARIAKDKGIVAHENGRTSHKGNVPTMGGLAVFSGFYISVLLFVDDSNLRELNYLIAGSFLILLTGMKDDMAGISARKKLIIQIISACIIIFWANLRFTSLQGFLGIYEINYFWSVTITLITIVGLTNCFNLIDGIDGLAAGVSSVSLVAMGLWFGFVNQHELMMISFILASALLSFIPYNVYGHTNKIFLGDTGSLTIGFIIAYLVLKFNQVNLSLPPEYVLKSAPAISIAIVFVPLFDTIKVFILRIFKGKHPFTPDKQHAHHTLLCLGLSHAQTSMYLVGLNAAFIFVAFGASSLGTTALFFVLLVQGVIVFFIPRAIKRKKGNKPILQNPLSARSA